VSIRVARLRPAPYMYTEYWSRLPARHLPILSPSAYAALAPLLPSNSLHAPGGTMFEMLGRLSDQFFARHTGPGCLRGPLLILSPSACATVAHLFPSSSLPRTRKDGATDRRWVPLTTHHHKLDHRSRHTCRWRVRASIKDRKLFSLRIAIVVNIPPST